MIATCHPERSTLAMPSLSRLGMARASHVALTWIVAALSTHFFGQVLLLDGIAIVRILAALAMPKLFHRHL